MTDTEQSPDWRSLLDRSLLPSLAVIFLGIWLHAASSMITATTLPRAVPDIGGANYIGWAFTLYQLGSILVGAASGLFVVRFGLRVTLLSAGGLYGMGCVISAISPDMAMMLAGRLLQGVGGGGLMAAAYVALHRLFPRELMSRLVALASAIWIISAFCGPLIGGVFANAGLWRFAYWAFAGQATLFIAAVLLLIPDTNQSYLPKHVSVPTRRLIVIAAAVVLIAVAGVTFNVAVSALLCILGFGLFYVFLALDNADAANRMLPGHPFDFRTTLGAGLLLILCASIATMSLLVYGPFLLTMLYGVTPLTAGYIVAIESVAWGLAAVFVGGARESSEKSLIRIGSVTVTVGIIGLAVFMPIGPLWAVWPWAACQGMGFGLMWAFVVRRIVAAASNEERDIASSAIPVTQQIGFAVGAAIVGMIANATGFSERGDTATIKFVSFWVFAAFLPLALLANAAAWRVSR